MYTYKYTYINICIRIYIRIHTYIYTYIPLNVRYNKKASGAEGLSDDDDVYIKKFQTRGVKESIINI
jgi:hypothetical protein